jgi:maltose phosphorylase
MKNYLTTDEWRIIETGFDPQLNKLSESIFSLGNGYMGQRGNFEETYTGETLQGNYFAGIYYPDKTRVGWWKNGYPEYFAKVLNAVNWIGIHVKINGEPLDIANCTVTSFRRTLHMKEGWLGRELTATLKDGKIIKLSAQRFCSIANEETGALSYELVAVNFDGELILEPCLDGTICNEDANYEEVFWEEVSKGAAQHDAWLQLRTRKTGFITSSAMRVAVFRNGKPESGQPEPVGKEKYVAFRYLFNVKKGESIRLEKFCSHASSRNHPEEALNDHARQAAGAARVKGFQALLEEQRLAWAKKWTVNDIRIEGDPAAQQGIRFNIFQLNQTYSGKDSRLNIGPKGFTGEKYGGSTYWDTEAYCLPFYLATAPPEVSRNLLLYRYNHLQKAI